MQQGFSIIEDTQPIQVDTAFVVIYGLPGVGKTSLSFTMPGNILHVDSDNGIQRAEQRLRPKTVRISEYGGFFHWVMSAAFAEYVKANEIKTVVLDTVGTLLDDYAAPWLIRNDPKNGNNSGGLGLPGWGALKTNFNALKSRFKALGINGCCICHAKEEGESNTRRFELAVSGGSSDIICRSADLIGFMTVQGDRRILNFNPTNSSLGKNVGNIAVQTIPNAGSEEFDSFLSGIVSTLMENMRSQSAAQIEFNKAFETWKDLIESKKTVADMEELMGNIKALPVGLLRKMVGQKFGDRINDLGFVADKETGKVTKAKKQEEATSEPEPEKEVDHEQID